MVAAEGAEAGREAAGAEARATAEVAFVMARRDLAAAFGARDRLVHGDCKIDNLLFQRDSARVACIIDLDTVMRMQLNPDVLQEVEGLAERYLHHHIEHLRPSRSSAVFGQLLS